MYFVLYSKVSCAAALPQHSNLKIELQSLFWIPAGIWFLCVAARYSVMGKSGGHSSLHGIRLWVHMWGTPGYIHQQLFAGHSLQGLCRRSSEEFPMYRQPFFTN